MSSNNQTSTPNLLQLQFHDLSVWRCIVEKFQYTSKTYLAKLKKKKIKGDAIANGDNIKFTFRFSEKKADENYFCDATNKILYLNNNNTYEIDIRLEQQRDIDGSDDDSVKLAWYVLEGKDQDKVKGQLKDIHFSCTNRVKLPKLKAEDRRKCFTFGIKKAETQEGNLSQKERLKRKLNHVDARLKNVKRRKEQLERRKKIVEEKLRNLNEPESNGTRNRSASP